MFKFLKSLFGGDPVLNKQAAIHIEQVPYKVESPVTVPVSHSDVVVLENKSDLVNQQPIEKPVKTKSKSVAATKPKKPIAKKSANKTRSESKTAANKTSGNKRKPKSTT